MNEPVSASGGPGHLHGSSFESFADAVANALSANPGEGEHRLLEVVRLRVEEGGVVGRVQYHADLVDLRRQREGRPGVSDLPSDESGVAGVIPSRPAVDDGAALGQLHPELRSRILAATAHAQHRLINGPSGDGEYEVYAVTDDRLVHMVLSMDPSGSVNEVTQTLVRGQIVAVTVAGDEGTIEVEDAGGRRAMSIPIELAHALGGASPAPDVLG